MSDEERLAFWTKALERFCKTLTNGLDEIAKDFVTGSSNGRTNFKRFRLRVLDRFGRPVTT